MIILMINENTNIFGLENQIAILTLNVNYSLSIIRLLKFFRKNQIDNEADQNLDKLAY